MTVARRLRDRRARRDLLSTARRMSDLGLVVGSVGNVSVRCDDRVLITPTRMPYARLRRRDVVAVTISGRRISGRHQPSRELPVHLAVYSVNEQARAIVHTHSAWAVTWSFFEEPLPALLEEQAYYEIGSVPVVAPAAAGSGALVRLVAAVAGDAKAVLLARHGVLAWGADPRDALVAAEVVERAACAAWLLRSTTPPIAALGPALRLTPLLSPKDLCDQ